MALRLFPQVARALRAAPVGARPLSRSPEQFGVFDWLTKKAAPEQDAPVAASPSVSTSPVTPTTTPAAEGPVASPAASAEAVQASQQSAEPVATNTPPTPSPADASSSSSSPAAADTPSSPAAASDAPSPSAPSTSDAEAPPVSEAAPSSSASTSTASPAPSPFFPSSGKTFGITVTPPLTPRASGPPPTPPPGGDLPISYKPPPPPPEPPLAKVPTPEERWTTLNATRREQLFAQNARPASRFDGRTFHFRPGDVARSIGQVQGIVRSNNIRTELVRNEYFEPVPQRRWRKRREFWSKFITVGMRKNVAMVKLLRERHQLPRR